MGRQSSGDNEEDMSETSIDDGKTLRQMKSSRNAVAQDAHLRHYQEHLEERRMKNKRLREGKLVTLLRKKPTVVEKRDVACQVTPADLGLDDWEDDDEDEDEEEEYDVDFSNYRSETSRPASAAPGPGPWQDVSTTNFNAEAYQQWYGNHWLGQNKDCSGMGYPADQPLENAEGMTLTQEQTYRYVYYYYNYYAAMEANEGGFTIDDEYHGNFSGNSQNYMGSTAANRPGAWHDTDAMESGGAAKKQMRDLFDEWRQKYESWYSATFGKDVRDIQREEDLAIMAHRAQLEAARLTALREEQEQHLERPGRPDSLLPAPPLGHDALIASFGGESSDSLLPPPPPSAPPPETPPPPPETPRPETPAAQVAAAAAAAHILGANMSTPADVAAAIARLSNSDLTSILSSVNRATSGEVRSATPASTTSDTASEAGRTSPATTASSTTLLRLPPLPVIGLPNPLATPIFPPPMPFTIRRDGLTATATLVPTPSTTLVTPVMIALPPSLPASLAPPSIPSGLPSIPQTMLLQPSMKFGPPFKPFGVFQGSTEDKWGPEAPLGRYGLRKEEEEKEAKLKLETRKKHMNEQLFEPPKRMNGQMTNGSITTDKDDHTDEAVNSNSPTNSNQNDLSSDDGLQVVGEAKEDQEDDDKISEKENNEDVNSDRDDDTESISSGDSMCSTATQSVAIGPRRGRVAPSVASGVGTGGHGARPSKLFLANAVNTSSIPVEKLTSLAESAAKRAVSDGLWYAPSQPLNSLRLPKQAMIHTLQSHLKSKVADLQAREKDPKLQLTLSYAKFLMDVVRHLLDMSVQFIVGSFHRLPTERAKNFYGSDIPEEMANSMKLCDVYIGDVFIAQGCSNSTLGAKEAASRQAFKVLSRPGYILGSTRLWQEADHLVLCISEFPLTVPILPPFLMDPCSPSIVHGPQLPTEFGPQGPGGDGVDEEIGWEMEDEEDWQLQSVAINPKPLENLWLYEKYDEAYVEEALLNATKRKEERQRMKLERQQRREIRDGSNMESSHGSEENESSSSGPSSRSRRRSSVNQSGNDDVHETALADMAALSLALEDDVEETASQSDEGDPSVVEVDPEAMKILARSCDFSHMMLSIEVEVNRDATFTCCVFIDRQFCADATDQPTVQQARELAVSRALALLRLSQPAVGLDGPEVSEDAFVDSLMWVTRNETVRPVIPLMMSYDMKSLEWDKLFMYYAESATIEPFFITEEDLHRSKWPDVKKEAEKWGLLVKESAIAIPGEESDEPNKLSLFVCKRMPLTTVKRKLMRQCRCGHFLLLRRGVYPTSEDEEQFSIDDDDEDEENVENRTSLLTASEVDLTPKVAVEIKEEPPEEEEPVDDLIFLGGAPTSSECEIIDDLPKTIIPGFDY